MDTRPRKVLIADDEPDIIKILKYNLEKENYQVITAKDGDEALDKARNYLPDLIVLDMMMPRKNLFLLQRSNFFILPTTGILK